MEKYPAYFTDKNHGDLPEPFYDRLGEFNKTLVYHKIVTERGYIGGTGLTVKLTNEAVNAGFNSGKTITDKRYWEDCVPVSSFLHVLARDYGFHRTPVDLTFFPNWTTWFPAVAC